VSRSLLIGLVLAVLAAAGWAAVRFSRTTDAEATTPASIAVAEQREFTPRITSTGNIRLMAGARVNVGAQVSGVVVKLGVTQGSRVRVGDLIAQLDDREARARLDDAASRVSQLTADSTQAETEAARIESLFAAHGTTDIELVSARTRRASTISQIAGARAQLDLARINLDRMSIRAPVSGVVASVTTHEGETVAASFAAPTFVTIVDPTRLECIALVDETDIGRVRPGQEAEFTVDAWPAQRFKGTVTRIAPDATIIGGVVDYEVTLRITEGMERLKPQMTANVTIAVEGHRALVLPSAAVRQGAQGLYVWRLRGARTERVAVTAGVRQLDLTEITSGVAAGDSVLTAGFPEERPAGSS
jgi:RND family efflux transporter MFP subunit